MVRVPCAWACMNTMHAQVACWLGMFMHLFIRPHPVQAQLGLPGPVAFYRVLARHYAGPRGGDAAIALLHVLQVGQLLVLCSFFVFPSSPRMPTPVRVC